MSRDVPSVAIDVPDGLGESQVQAILTSLSKPVSVVTGGPGTGKTTIAKVIASAHRRVLGLSPTGKGADRLAESLGVECFTIHRAIFRASIEELDFSAFDLIAVDEAGMLDTEGLEMLMRWLHKHETQARLVFFGDTGQLPSVGPGKVLSELMACCPTEQLLITYRFSDFDIGQACQSARAGHLHDQSSQHYRLIEGDETEAYRSYLGLVNKHGLDNVRLITYHTEDARRFNERCRRTVKGQPPVVCTRNNYRHNVMNGSQGIQSNGGNLEFYGRSIPSRGILWTYAYGSTCHKAQGGQWPGVVVWIPSARFVSREWLLTACSRPECDLVIVVRDAATTERCLASSKPSVSRVSLLADFVTGSAAWES